MPVIRGNDVFTINGARIAKQGAAHLKEGMSPAEAAAKTKKNGMDEMIVAFEGPDGKPERLIIYGDNLDFSFRKSRTEPDVRLNGEPGMLVHFEDEPNGFLERMQRGLTDGFKDAMDSLAALAHKSVEGVAYAGAASFLGGTIWVAATKGAALGILKDAAIVLGPKIAMGIGATAAIGAGVLIVSAVVKAIASGGNETKMETIAEVVDDNPKKGIASKPAPALPTPTMAAPEAPASNASGTPGVNARPIRIRAGG
jgi:hypothetical protein